eukprot:3528589-Rhodomonas_salina.2
MITTFQSLSQTGRPAASVNTICLFKARLCLRLGAGSQEQELNQAKLTGELETAGAGYMQPFYIDPVCTPGQRTLCRKSMVCDVRDGEILQSRWQLVGAAVL